MANPIAVALAARNSRRVDIIHHSDAPFRWTAEGMPAIRKGRGAELYKAAHDDGLVALARMDCNRTAEHFFRTHPDWFARDSSGNPYRAADKYITCINSRYYDEYIPGVPTEIIDRSHPQRFADNSWASLGRDSICYCGNCARKVRETTGQALPKQHDWNDAAYRQWIEVELRAPAGSVGHVQPHDEIGRRP